MTSLQNAAAGYGRRGLYVFPVAGKEPLTEHGFLDAVTGETEALTLFRQHPRATGVALDCGRSGLLVVDVDGPVAEDSWAFLTAGRPIATLEAATGRPEGGRHLYFRTTDPRSVNSAKKIGAGIDTRGGGGYVILPPSWHPSGRNYRWANRQPILSAPEWILAALAPAPRPPTGEYKPPPSDAHATSYGRSALYGLAEQMLAAQEGARNDTLRRTSCRAGRLEAAGELDAAIAEGVLTQAAIRVGLSLLEAERTFKSGFSFGQQYPTARAPRP